MKTLTEIENILKELRSHAENEVVEFKEAKTDGLIMPAGKRWKMSKPPM